MADEYFIETDEGSIDFYKPGGLDGEGKVGIIVEAIGESVEMHLSADNLEDLIAKASKARTML